MFDSKGIIFLCCLAILAAAQLGRPGDAASLLNMTQKYLESQGIPEFQETEVYRCACTDCDSDVCFTHKGVGCFVSLHKTTILRGCGHKDESQRLNCQGKIRGQSFITSERAISCCQSDMCNRDLVPRLMEVKRPKEAELNTDLVLVIVIPIIITIVFILLAFLLFRYLKHRRDDMQENSSVREEFLPEKYGLRAQQVGDSTLREMFDESYTSGSGSGLPFLVQQTVARQVTLLECIGKGRYGDVWRGLYHGEDVAVKIFSSRDEASWSRETEIYSTCLLRHDNILAYFASDMTSRNSCTQLWLIMKYHENGSLFDFLHHTVLDYDAMFLLMSSLAAGLLHLHTEIMGNQGKPAIAHRDIKSKNILVKADRTCCIGDLGLAVMHTQEGDRIDLGRNNKVGTKRYMSPELLDETLNTNQFESFKAVDVYALGLVLWEIARRCSVEGLVEEYRPPFWDMVPSDPSFEDMRKVVAVEKRRPEIPNRWLCDVVMRQVAQLINECWSQNSRARLPMLRVRKSLSNLAYYPRKEKALDLHKLDAVNFLKNSDIINC